MRGRIRVVILNTSMKDLSFFLLKNSVGAKMKKGIRNFCHGDGSTSTLNQQHQHQGNDIHHQPSVVESSPAAGTTTLEEMILRLELEEELARKAKLNEYSEIRGGRRSCVNNSDILRSARNALNQYPRFSLDGKDAMYRSSFRNSENIMIGNGRNSVCGDYRLRERYCKSLFLPSTFGGERVVWCKPGVVAKLMGLEFMPVPISRRQNKLGSLIKRHNLRRAERHEMDRMSSNNNNNNYNDFRKERMMAGSCSRPAAGYFVIKPVAVEPETGDGGWPTRRFHGS